MVSEGNRSRSADRHRTWRMGIAYSLISMVIGLFVVLFIGLGDPSFYTPVQFAFGALFGFFISAGAFAFEWLLYWLLRDRLADLPVRLLGYAIGGAVGHLVAYTITLVVFHDVAWDRASLPFRSLLFGVFAAAIGLGFYAYEQLQYRLRLREAELRRSEVAAALAENELEIARSIQKRLLPPAEASGPGYELSARNVAARVVAGDFYDVLPEGDRSLLLVVGDVAGKGVGASLIMASVKAVLPLMAADRSVSAALVALNDKLRGELDRREFVALALARLDLDTGDVHLSNAGLPDPLVVRAGGETEPVEVSGPRLPLGALPGTAYEESLLRLEIGDRLLMYTDGLPEAQVEGRELGYERFAEIASRPAATPSEWLDAILGVLGSRAGEDDDQTLVALERTVGSARGRAAS